MKSPRRLSTAFYPLLAMTVAMLSLAVSLPVIADPPSAGLVGYWPFDGSFDDASGNGNHATSLGAELTSDRYGRPNSAVAVSDAQFVLVPDSPSLALTDAFTLAAWIRQDAITRAFNCVVSKDHATAFGACIDSGGSGDCPDPNATRWMVLKIGGTRRYFSATSFDCGTGEWTHVAVSFDASTAKARLYVDGVLLQTADNSGTLAPSSSALGIGNNGNSGDCYTGLLDDVCLYNRVLSDAEVDALFRDQMVTPSVENPGVNAYVVSASAHAPGINQTSWVTDVVLHNPGTGDATVDLFLLASRTDNTLATPYRVTVPASSSLLLADVVADLFGLDEQSGAVLVGSDRPLIVSSRTFNNAASGTYGQLIPGVSTATAWEAGPSLPRLVQLAHSPDSGSGFRTNLGVVNLGPSTLTIDVDLHAGAGDALGTVQLVAPPYGHVQLSNVFAAHTTEKLDDAFAQVGSVSTGGRYLLYASIVDNRSGDPVFIAAR